MILGDVGFNDRCQACKRHKLYVSKREIPMPTGGTARSQILMCGKCFGAIRKILSTDKPLQENKSIK